MQITAHIIDRDASILDGLQKLNDLNDGHKTLFVVGREGNVCGALTDGDIRRALLAGAQLSQPVSTVMHQHYRSICADAIDVTAIKEYRRMGIRLVPVVNDRGALVDIADLSEDRSMLPLNAILMAGGKGERLRPLTLNTPKPLLEIGGKAIIDYNIETLAKCGIKDITVTTNYLADQIERHFSAPVYGIQVKCVNEPKPLGTIGSAALVDLEHMRYADTIVMNSDLLTTISFEDMYLHHVATHADITVAVIPYQISVPFAILTTSETDPELVTGIEEKPSYSYFANAGIYIFNNRILRMLDAEVRTDATDLIEMSIALGYRVTQFPINGTWIDIGSPTDFRQACELIKYVQRSNF